MKKIQHLTYLMLLLLVAACGGDTPAEPEAEEPEVAVETVAEEMGEGPMEESEEEVAEEDAAAAFPMTIEHAFGNITLEAEPERIVSIGYADQDTLFALDVNPVAVRYWFGPEDTGGIFPWAADDFTGEELPDVLNMTFGELNYELILSYNPDLIVAVSSGITAEEYEQLEQIAPTLAQSGNYNNFGMPWDEAALLIGEAVGRLPEAEALVADVHAQFEEAVANHPEFVDKDLVVATGGRYAVFSTQDARPRFFQNLGFAPQADLDELTGANFYTELSEERVDLLDRDVVVFTQASYLPEGADSITNDPLLAQLDVIEDGRYIILSEEIDGAFSFSSVLSLPYAIEQLVPQLAEVLGTDSMASEAMAESDGCEAGYRLFESELLFTDPICVPEDPQRIAFIDELVGLVPVLGVESVTRSVYFDLFNNDFPNAFSADEIAAMTDIGHPRSTNAETMLLAEPDLIISGNYWTDANQFLGEIAPTVIWDWDYTTDWTAYFQALAELLNRGDEAQQVLDGIAERMDILQAEIGETGESYVVVRTMDELDNIQVFTTYNFGAEHVAKLGLSMPDEILTPEEAAEVNNAWWYPLSIEALPDIDADHVFMLSGWEPEIQEEFMANPLWQTLDAVQNDNVYFIEGEYWVRTHPIAAHRIIDDIFTYVAEVDPADVAPNPFAYTYESESMAAEVSNNCEDGFRSVDHEILEAPICVPENPERIVAADVTALELMLMLDMQPVARPTADFIMNLYAAAPALLEKVESILGDTPVYGVFEINVEVLLEAEPDLVITYNQPPEGDQIREFTTLVENPIPGRHDSWTELSRFYAEVLGVTDEFEALLADYEGRVDVLRENIGPEFDGASLVFVQNSGELNYVGLPGLMLWETIGDAGFVPVDTLPTTKEEAIAEFGNPVFQINDELISLLAADVIIMVNGNVTREDLEVAAEIIEGFQTDPLWNTLPALQTGQFYPTSVYWQSNGIVSAHAVLDDMFVNFTDINPDEVAPNPFLSE